jgi:hypothetical protein
MIEEGFKIGLGIALAFGALCVAGAVFMVLFFFYEMSQHNREADRLRKERG